TEMQNHGFTSDQIESALKRTTNKKLTETPHRMLVEDDNGAALLQSIDKCRLTAKGAYHLRRWLPNFAYLDAMVFDTPLFDAGLREELLPDIESFDIAVRLMRATSFKAYLRNKWRQAQFRCQYLDLEEILLRGDQTFARVRR